MNKHIYVKVVKSVLNKRQCQPKANNSETKVEVQRLHHSDDVRSNANG